MRTELKTVAVLCDNEALSAIVEMVLSSHRSLRVRTFKDEATLRLYMLIAPVELLVCDNSDVIDPIGVVSRLRATPELASPGFQAVILSRTADPSLRALCAGAGIDEVMLKPVSPRYLEDRVLARLNEVTQHRVADIYLQSQGQKPASRNTDRSPSRRSANVVPLFGVRPTPEWQPHA